MTVGLPQQRSCGTMSVHYRLLTTDLAYATNRREIENRSLEYERRGFDAARAGITVIPVVVHVVYNSSTPAQNISDAQIFSQIDVLNRDFRKLNPDIASIPAPFQPLAIDARIQFALATIDPNGNPTNGITRTATTATGFADDDRVKSAATRGADPWPSDRYLNLWVCQLNGGLLGYAQFPGGPAATDGVVITHTGFGTTGTAAAPFNLGRTATHEIGHWLNLRHIWGDDGNGCNGSDFVDDTPNQAGPNFGKPSFPHVTCNNAPNGDMFMNYMDYTDDAAMFMFTAGQVARMQAVLNHERANLGTAFPNANKLYQLHKDGKIYQYMGTVCSGESCLGWKMLDSNPATVAIASSADNLYQLHKDGSIYQYIEKPHSGESLGWKILDNNSATIAIVASGDNLYQLHKDGLIFEYTGKPRSGEIGWQMLDNNSATIAITANEYNLYQLHKDGRIYQYTKNLSGEIDWEMLDNNSATVAIVASGDNLYQLHKDGRIYKYTGTSPYGERGWEMLDNNSATSKIGSGTASLL